MAEVINLHNNNVEAEGTAHPLELPLPPTPGEITRQRKDAFMKKRKLQKYAA